MADFHAVCYLEGFDETASPGWQMVPVGGERFVALRAGTGLTVSCNAPNILTVQEIPVSQLPSSGHMRLDLEATDRVFRLQGAAKGSARIEARQDSTVAAALAVNTKDRKRIRISFHLVRDSAGHHTARSQASVAPWLPLLNGIFQGQANIQVDLGMVREVTVRGDLGSPVRIGENDLDDWNRITSPTNRDASAWVNFFLVWDLDYTHSPVDWLEGLMSRDGAGIMEDSVHGFEALNVAHEVGHRFGLRDDYNGAHSRQLMYGYPNRGNLLTRDQINLMNP